MLPNSTTTTPAFIHVEPDWSVTMTSLQKWRTHITTSWDGTEQRASRRNRALFDLQFTTGAWTEAEWPARRAALLSEFEGPVVVPNWPFADLVVSIVDDVVTLDRTTLESAFKAGGYVYFVSDGLPSCFRRITARAGATLTLASGLAAYPAITPPAYGAGTLAFPCITGIRKENRGEWEHRQLDATAEIIRVEEL